MNKKVTITIDNLTTEEYIDLIKRVNEFGERAFQLNHGEQLEEEAFPIPGGSILSVAMFGELKVNFSTHINMKSFQPETASVMLSYTTQE
jgi:hypothetical protein